MKSIVEVLKTTILGGVLFLIPVGVVVVVLAKVVQIMGTVAEPLGRFIPIERVGGIAVANLIVIVALVLICLVAGIVAKGDRAKRLVERLEATLVNMIPGYTFIKGMVDSVAQSDHLSENFIPVIATFDDNAQVAFEVDRKDDYVVVYLPGAPNPWSGSVIYMKEERVKKLDVPVTEAIKGIQTLGTNAAKHGETIPDVQAGA